jgi:hypothetical protein
MFHCNFEQEKIKTTSSLKSIPLRAKKSKKILKTKSNNDIISMKSMQQISSSSIEKLDENFCGAFQEHYEYLMDKGLIETCQVSLRIIIIIYIYNNLKAGQVLMINYLSCFVLLLLMNII